MTGTKSKYNKHCCRDDSATHTHIHIAPRTRKNSAEASFRPSPRENSISPHRQTPAVRAIPAPPPTHLGLVARLAVAAAQRAPPGGRPAERQRAQEAAGRRLGAVVLLGRLRELTVGAAAGARRRRRLALPVVGRRTAQALADAAFEDADGADGAVDSGPGGGRGPGLLAAHWRHGASTSQRSPHGKRRPTKRYRTNSQNTAQQHTQPSCCSADHAIPLPRTRPTRPLLTSRDVRWHAATSARA